VELSINDTNWIAATGTSSWSGTLTLRTGQNTVYARVTDTAGNSQVTSIGVNLQEQNPSAPVQNQGLTGSLNLVLIALAIVASLIVAAVVIILRRASAKGHRGN
jgi:subtilase family serine protease